MDDRRLGAALRALRRRRGLRQLDVARQAGLAQPTVSLVERGHLDRLSIRTLRALFAAVDARYEGGVVWRGGGLDRLLDERHAALAGAVVRRLHALGWDTDVEVTYAIGTERGSIDVLAWHEVAGLTLVVELKTELASLEETLRHLDAKVRVSPGIAIRRHGRRTHHTARMLVLLESGTNRGRVARQSSVLSAAFPMRGSAARSWLRQPEGPASLLWMLRLSNGDSDKRRLHGPDRVRRPRTPAS